jgi:hypothetical protein
LEAHRTASNASRLAAALRSFAIERPAAIR